MLSPCQFLSSGSIKPPSPPVLKFHPPPGATTSAAHDPASYRISPSNYNNMYEILRIPVGASIQEIKSAYRRLARTCHPDVVATDRRESSSDEFMKIQTAYSTLSDPQKRALYDREIFRPLTSVSGLGGYRRRNWETDQCW